MAKTELCKLRFEIVEVQLHHSIARFISKKKYGWCGKYQSDELHIEWSKGTVAANFILGFVRIREDNFENMFRLEVEVEGDHM